jgi:DNA-binding transcriptional MerR regulator
MLATESLCFSGHQAAKVVGITYRQLDYWARTDLVRPSITDAKGSGSQRQYSYQDLLKLKLIKQLLDQGLTLQAVRSALESLAKLDDLAGNPPQLVIVGNGKTIFAKDGDDLVDLMNGNQMAFSMLLSVGRIRDGLDAEIVNFASSEGKSVDSYSVASGGGSLRASI